MYEEDEPAADQKMEDETSVHEPGTVNAEQVVAAAGGIGVGVGIGIGGSGGGAAGSTGLAGYWQHATTGTGYWSSMFDCWTSPPITSGSQTLSLPRDDN